MIKTRLMNREEAATFLKVSPGSIANWTLRAGLPHFREAPGHRVFYSDTALTEWVKRVQPEAIMKPRRKRSRADA